MGLLAYDPERVARLHRSMSRAADDLHTINCADPAAAEAMRLVRTAVSQLEHRWLPLVRRLLTTDPLSSRARDALGFGALDQSLVTVMADGYGWSVQSDDRTDAAGHVTPEEARALASMLHEIDPEALAGDAARLQWLARQLAIIGRDPVLSAEFLVDFDEWDVLPLVLAHERAGLFRPTAPASPTPRDIDAVFDGLMAIWRVGLPPQVLAAGTQASVAALLPGIQYPDPYVQALMLRSLQLDPMTLATVTDELLVDWLDRKAEHGTWATIDLGEAYGPNAADLLLSAIALDPIASVRFLALAADHPAVLFETLDDPGIGYRVILLGTDPAHTTAALAEPAVLSILGYFRDDPYDHLLITDGYPGDYGPFLGNLVAPWLLQFTNTQGNTDDQWQADEATKVELLRVALRDPASLQRLADDSGLTAARFAASAGVGDVVRAREVGTLLALIHQLVIEERVDDEAARTQAGWNLLWSLLGASTGLLKVAPVVGALADFGIRQFGDALADELLDQPDPQGERHRAQLLADISITVMAAQLLAALVAAWQHDGTLPDDVLAVPEPDIEAECPSAEWRRQLNNWLAALPGGSNGVLAEQADLIVGQVLGNSMATEHCAELTS